MQLTQEYFDKGIANILELMATKKDLNQGLGSLETKLLAKMATKDDLRAQTVELKQYTHEAFETQQRWADRRFDELIVKYDVRERVIKLEKDVEHLKLNLPTQE